MGCIMKQAPFLPYYQTHFFQLTPIVFFFFLFPTQYAYCFITSIPFLLYIISCLIRSDDSQIHINNTFLFRPSYLFSRTKNQEQESSVRKKHKNSNNPKKPIFFILFYTQTPFTPARDKLICEKKRKKCLRPHGPLKTSHMFSAGLTPEFCRPKFSSRCEHTDIQPSIWKRSSNAFG